MAEHLRNSGGSMIESCGDRQQKCDGLEKWPLHSLIESLPIMHQAAILLLASGLCRCMWSINTFIAYTLIILTGLGVIFYISIVIIGTSSCACQFQTPFVVHERGFGMESSPLSSTPNGCSYVPARCGAGGSGRFSATNLSQ